MTNAISLKAYLLALGTVAVLAVGALSFSAMFAHAEAGPAVSTKTTTASNAVVTSAPIGSAVFEVASVASSTASSTPTGTVTFSTFNNLTCSGAPAVQSGVALVAGAATSSANLVTAAGLSYLVNYNGDASNTPSVSSCAIVTPTSAAVSITNALSATSVLAGSSVTAQAALSGNTANASGTVAYNVYTNNTCTAATTSPAPVTVINGIVPASPAIAFHQAGTYFVKAVYSGDTSNSAAASSCGMLTVNASAATTTVGDDHKGHKHDDDEDIATSTSNVHQDNDNDNDDDDGNDGQGNSEHEFHLPNLHANFHAFLKGESGKHEGDKGDDNEQGDD